MYKIPLGKDLILDEAFIYNRWVENNCFSFDKNCSGEKNFIFVLPPPNANGELHLGHSFGYTIMDCIGRFKRQQGFNVLLIPGKDHAGIQTQVVFEKLLRSKGIDPRSLTREEIYRQCYEFCMDRAQYMRAQEKSLGLGADWDYELFTLDPAVSEIVVDTFIKLYQDGLAYRADRIVNWSVESNTSISDIEVEYVEQKGKLYYIVYPWADSMILDDEANSSTLVTDYEPYNNAVLVHFLQPPSVVEIDGLGQYVYFSERAEGKHIFLKKFDVTSGIVVATTRPETMLGDSAVAVHPEDPRYKKFIGREVIVPEANRRVKIVAHHDVDPTYGTGAVKITPAHDFFDFEVGKQLGLQVIQVIGRDGRITEEGGKYKGLTTFEARQLIIDQLEQQNLLVDLVEIIHKVPISERAKDIIEPLVTEQWWVNLSGSADKALQLINNGELEVYPSEFKNLIIQWLKNLKDWNVSRQLWWGHRIPAWFKDGKLTGISQNQISDCTQDPDTFDTWFSSGQWAYTTLVAKGLLNLDRLDSKFYPTHMMVMGRDILFFWACRMILLGVYRTNKIPFKKLYFHGLILDEKGQKMSKSRGNGVEPGEIQRKFGTDVLRLSLLAGFSPGRDVRFSLTKCEAWSKFINKLLNAGKFVSSNLPAAKSFHDIVHPLNKFFHDLSLKKLDEYLKGLTFFEFSSVLDNIYLYFWDTFCDWFIEFSKVMLRTEFREEQQHLLSKLFEHILFMFHPFAPFITEFLHTDLLKFSNLLAKRKFADYESNIQITDLDEKIFSNLKNMVRSLRRMRIYSKEAIQFYLESDWPYEAEVIAKLSGCDYCKNPFEGLKVVFRDKRVILKLRDLQKVREELMRALEDVSSRIQKLSSLFESDFVDKAPINLVEKERKRLDDLILERDELQSQLESLK